MRGTLRIAASALVATTLLLAAGASAEETAPTRADYVAAVEPICEANANANKRILRNVRVKARDGRMKQAGAQFSRAATAFGAAVTEMATVPRPPEDAERLGRWFKQLRVVQGHLRKLAAALKKEDRILAAHEQIRVERSSNAANNVGFVFGFRQCRLTASRFT